MNCFYMLYLNMLLEINNKLIVKVVNVLYILSDILFFFIIYFILYIVIYNMF